MRLNTDVSRIIGNAGGGYSLYGSGNSGQEELGTFDAVIIAAPISLAGIALDLRGEVSRRHFACYVQYSTPAVLPICSSVARTSIDQVFLAGSDLE